MKKIILALLLASACLVSCDGGSDKDIQNETTPSTSVITTAPEQIDISELAEKALSEISFDLPLEILDSSAAEYLYPGLPEGCESVIYYTGGAGAEELAVFRSSESDAVKTVVEAHRAEQRTGFASYKPADVEKIDNAVLIQSGEYTVFCISADHEKAKSVIEGLLK